LKKKYAIEQKLIKPMFTKCYTANLEYIGESELPCYFNDWHVWRKYATERQRDEAFKVLSAKSDLWEYRKKDLK
jgi:hypothetical protein